MQNSQVVTVEAQVAGFLVEVAQDWTEQVGGSVVQGQGEAGQPAVWGHCTDKRSLFGSGLTRGGATTKKQNVDVQQLVVP